MYKESTRGSPRQWQGRTSQGSVVTPAKEETKTNTGTPYTTTTASAKQSLTRRKPVEEKDSEEAAIRTGGKAKAHHRGGGTRTQSHWEGQDCWWQNRRKRRRKRKTKVVERHSPVTKGLREQVKGRNQRGSEEFGDQSWSQDTEEGEEKKLQITKYGTEVRLNHEIWREGPGKK